MMLVTKMEMKMKCTMYHFDCMLVFVICDMYKVIVVKKKNNKTYKIDFYLLFYLHKYYILINIE